VTSKTVEKFAMVQNLADVNCETIDCKNITFLNNFWRSVTETFAWTSG